MGLTGASTGRQAGGEPGGFDWGQYRQQHGGAGQAGRGFEGDFGDFFGGAGAGAGGGFSDFFENIFGGGFAGAKRGGRSAGFKGQDFQASLEISLQEAYNGTTRNFTVNGQQLRISLKPGIESGQTLKLKGKGGAAPQGGQPGDLYLTIQVAEHPQFKREGSDLRTDIPVDIYTLVLGGKVTVPALSGPVKLTLPPRTPNEKVLRLKEKGMPVYGKAGQFGHLYVKVKAELPQELSAEEEALFRQLQDLKTKKYAGTD